MKRFFFAWGEHYLYTPSIFQKSLSLLLLPLSWLYCLIAYVRYVFSTAKTFDIPVVSVGNLTVGGSGKTPLAMELAKHFTKPAIILRGYGRKSSGMLVVRDQEIVCDINESGDEAMVYALGLPHAIVIVSEKRENAIIKAKELGCEVVFLDDGYGKHSIEKLDIVIDVETPNTFCLPSGAYREKLWSGKEAIVVSENRDFFRSVAIVNPTSAMVLVTAIARPQRLDPFLPDVIEKFYFEDHHSFTREEIEEILKTTGATSLLVTSKDLVKMSSFNLPLSILELSLELDEKLITTIKEYVYAT